MSLAHPGSGRDDSGFVLLLVISAVALLALVAASFAQMTRAYVRSATSTSEGARAEALADAGVNIAVLDLLRSQADAARSRRFALNGAPFSCRFDDVGALTISVQDEAGKVDLNSADDRLIRALVNGLGLAPAEAITDAILDFRDPNDDKRSNGAEAAEYREAGRIMGPKNAPVLVIEELGQVLGLDASIIDRLRPFVTLYTGQTSVDPEAAATELLEALSRGYVPSAAVQTRSPGMVKTRGGLLPADFVSPSIQRHFTIHSAAHTASGSRFVREAVVELGRPRVQQSFVFRRWQRGALRYDMEIRFESLPPC
jgi:general secretion pathway protein K